MVIGIIGGTGWMGNFLSARMIQTGWINPDKLWISNQNGKTNSLIDSLPIHFTTDNQILADHSQLVVLAVQPKHFNQVKISLKDQLVVSIMAGVTFDRIKQHTHADKIIRSMPNAAAEYGLSYTPWIANQPLSEQENKTIQTLLETIGQADQLKEERELNYFTGLTGAGPAFLSLFADHMIQAAIAFGIDAALAERSVRQLFLGGSTVLAHEQLSPSEIVKTFVDYAGTTAAGLKTMEKAGLKNIIQQGLQAAYEKASSDMMKS